MDRETFQSKLSETAIDFRQCLDQEGKITPVGRVLACQIYQERRGESLWRLNEAVRRQGLVETYFEPISEKLGKEKAQAVLGILNHSLNEIADSEKVLHRIRNLFAEDPPRALKILHLPEGTSLDEARQCLARLEESLGIPREPDERVEKIREALKAEVRKKPVRKSPRIIRKFVYAAVVGATIGFALTPIAREVLSQPPEVQSVEISMGDQPEEELPVQVPVASPPPPRPTTPSGEEKSLKRLVDIKIKETPAQLLPEAISALVYEYFNHPEAPPPVTIPGQLDKASSVLVSTEEVYAEGKVPTPPPDKVGVWLIPDSDVSKIGDIWLSIHNFFHLKDDPRYKDTVWARLSLLGPGDKIEVGGVIYIIDSTASIDPQKMSVNDILAEHKSDQRPLIFLEGCGDASSPLQDNRKLPRVVVVGHADDESLSRVSQAEVH